MKTLSVRNKAIVSAFVLPIIIFALISPLGKLLQYYALPPSTVKNVSIVAKNNELEVEYDEKREFDFAHYQLRLFRDGSLIQEIETEETRYLITELETGVEYELKIAAVDDTNRQSPVIRYTFTPDFQIQSGFLNEYSRVDNLSFYIIATSTVISILVVMLSLWIVRKKQSIQTFTNIVLFPTLIYLPMVLFTTSITFSINSVENLLIISILFAAGSGVALYLLFLTMNILHTAHYRQIPLEQAAKAAQFLFILISTYILLIYAFGSDLSFYQRTLTIIPFIGYYTYVSTWSLKEIVNSQIVIRTIVSTLIMVLAVTILSIWPVYYVYAMLVSAVIFYIMLSISLEIREKLNTYVWVEYSVLLIIVLVLLFSTASWGINGTII